MRQSHLFTKTLKDAPSDEVSKNAQLLIRAGYVHKELAGVYDLLPLGMRVVEKIKQIIREEMDRIGGQEFLMSSLQAKETWTKTNRWDDEVVDVWFKSQLKSGGEVGFGWSHEEPITEMMQNHLASYKDLPVYVYQFQNKFRNELRAKAGVMRGREFIMKDMYSFSLTEEQHDDFYKKATEAYKRCFDRLGIGEDTFVTFAAGGAFTEFSHEFQTISEAGEDEIYINREKNIAINEEVYSEETLKDLGVTADELEKVKTIETGNIFSFGTKKCEEMGLVVNNEAGEKVPVHLGSYGIGITRAMGAIVEKMADEKGIVWPEEVSPYQVHLVTLGTDDPEVVKLAESVYEALLQHGIEVLYDDRSVSPGQKLAESDLLGITTRMVIGRKTLESSEIEVVNRATGKTTMIAESDVLAGKIN